MKRNVIYILLFTQLIINAQSVQTTNPVRFLALGDSYTIGQSVVEEDRWPVQLVAALEENGNTIEELKIIAQTGWRTDNLITAINNVQPDSNYNLVSLLIGVNNQYQVREFSQYETEFEQLLSKAVALAGGKKESVFVVSIPDYGYTPFGESNQETISAEIDMYNLKGSEIADNYDIPFVNITPVSREGLDKPEYVAGDNLHPSEQMYTKWVDLILPLIRVTTSIDDYKPDDQVNVVSSVSNGVLHLNSALNLIDASVMSIVL